MRVYHCFSSFANDFQVKQVPFLHRLYVATEQKTTLLIHSLRRFLMFARQGELRQRKQEDLANQSSCLTLVNKSAGVAFTATTIATKLKATFPLQQGIQP